MRSDGFIESAAGARVGSIRHSVYVIVPEQSDLPHVLVKDTGRHFESLESFCGIFELLTGDLPFEGSPATLVHEVIHHDPPSPRKLDRRVPRDLETICLKCLEKDPKRRYGSAAELAADLRRYLAGEPIHARPLPAWGRAWRWVQRRPAAAALLAVSSVALLALVGMGVGLVYNDQLEFYQYFLVIARAHSAWENGNVVQAESELNGCAVDRQNFEYRYLKRLCHCDILTIDGHAGAVTAVTFSPDGKRIVSAGKDGTIKVWDAVSGKCISTLVGHSGPVTDVALSADGTLLASGGDDHTVRF